MKKLKFIQDEGTVFYKELTERIDAYFKEKKIAKTGNRQMHIKIAMYFCLDVIFYVLMLNAPHLGLFYLFYLLTGLSVLLTAFNVSHDAVHGVAVKSRFWNKFMFHLSFNLQGNNAYVWGKNHIESHHLYTNVEGSDIDVLNNPLVRMTDSQPLRWYHQFQYLYIPFLYLLYSLNWFLFRETLLLFNYSSRTISIHIPAKEVIKLLFFKFLYISYMILLPVYLLPFGWQNVLYAFVLNHFMISVLFTAVLGVSHLSDFVTHPKPDADGRISISWAKLQMTTSVDYNADSTFLNWTLGGFNAHALHHLLPNICHVHYPLILPIFREMCQKHGIVYMEMSYYQALQSHFRFLKKMGKQKEHTVLEYKTKLGIFYSK